MTAAIDPLLLLSAQIGLPIFVALVGFVFVHYLAVRRQRRDEIFKIVAGIQGRIDKVLEHGTRFSNEVDSTNREAARFALLTELARIEASLFDLRARKWPFKLAERPLASLRRVASLDVEGNLASPMPAAARTVRIKDLTTRALQFEQALPRCLRAACPRPRGLLQTRSSASTPLTVPPGLPISGTLC